MAKKKNLLSLVNGSRKALVPAVIAGVLFVLDQAGVSGNLTVEEAVTLGVTSVSVWFVRNK